MSLSELHERFKSSTGLCTDTRRIEAGNFFVALKGPSFDANEFVAKALEAGASTVVTEDQKWVHEPKAVVVENSLESLQALARYHRRQLGIPVIAIAGSNGKTTTKELTARVLSQGYSVWATPGNLNNHIGVPISLLQLTAEHELAVIEIGANHLGETDQLCQIAQPSHGLITNCGKDHLEGFGSIEAVIQANTELYRYLERTNGHAWVNKEDIDLMSNLGSLNHSTYGLSESADLRGSVRSLSPFLRCTLTNKVNDVDIDSQLYGSFQLYNILAAASIGLHFKVPLNSIGVAVASYCPANNRTQWISWRGAKVLLDAYNANPSSVEAILRDFKDYPTQKKGAILGDMLELGEASKAEHKNILEQLVQAELDFVCLIGPEFGQWKEEFGFLFCESREEAKEQLSQMELSSYSLLIKGSRGMALERMIAD